MCTLSFVATENGYLVAMNRDERLTRGESTLPPRIFANAVYPHEATGGTWIGARADGVTLALLNWTLRPGQTPGPRSRGLIIPELLRQPEISPGALGQDQLEQTAPFRLIAFLPERRSIGEWRWDGSRMREDQYPWQACHWFSSGAGDAEAEQHRGPVTAAASREADAGSLEWLRRLHRSHEPERGAFSVCAHRGIAGTLSYTEIEVGVAVSMRYRSGPPCSPTGDWVEVTLPPAARRDF